MAMAMRRDWDLIRRIFVLASEGVKPHPRDLGVDEKRLDMHLKLMFDRGWLNGSEYGSCVVGDDVDTTFRWADTIDVRGLTNDGHDVWNRLGSDAVWEGVKRRLFEAENRVNEGQVFEWVEEITRNSP